MRQSKIAREMIIEAAIRVVREKGLAGATTRAIVQSVPCGEGTLYLYFRHRSELILSAIEQVASTWAEQLQALPKLVGKSSVIDNLAFVLGQAAQFQEDALPLFSGIVSDPPLLKTQQVTMRKAGKGPHLSQKAIAQYLEAEKHVGRVHPDLESELIASFLLRSSFGRIFEERFSGRTSGAEAVRDNRSLITALLALRRKRQSANSRKKDTRA
ncbi:MAG TPA: TetR/AcrR family transcriptional regulator [Terriglobales bacterium]|nr:TetR/AcrR family transcriptional regulator [Terriglobales bacterium]